MRRCNAIGQTGADKDLHYENAPYDAAIDFLTGEIFIGPSYDTLMAKLPLEKYTFTENRFVPDVHKLHPSIDPSLG